jgi:hypothetical protein
LVLSLEQWLQELQSEQASSLLLGPEPSWLPVQGLQQVPSLEQVRERPLQVPYLPLEGRWSHP